MAHFVRPKTVPSHLKRFFFFFFFFCCFPLVIQIDEEFVNQRDMYGNTALHIAAKYANIQSMSALCKGAWDKLDPDLQNDDGKKAADIAQELETPSGSLCSYLITMLGKSKSIILFVCVCVF